MDMQKRIDQIIPGYATVGDTGPIVDGYTLPFAHISNQLIWVYPAFRSFLLVVKILKQSFKHE